MQVTFEKVESKDQEQAVIKAVEVTDEISGAIELLEGDAKGFAVSRDGKTLYRIRRQEDIRLYKAGLLRLQIQAL